MTEDVKFLDRFLTWAHACPEIRAALLIGSRARNSQPADQWSDYDLVLVTNRPEGLLDDDTWVAEFGTPLLTITEKTATGDLVERRVLYYNGQDVDFIPMSVDQFLSISHSGPPAGSLQRGFDVLMDKDGLSTILRELTPSPHEEISSHDLQIVVQDFWYHVVWTAKKLRRGELWVAKACCDVYLKNLLLRLIEWHARSTQGPDIDTWYRGRFLEMWAAPNILDRLDTAFAHYDANSIQNALIHTMNIFESLTKEVASRMAFPLDDSKEKRARELVMHILNQA